MATYRAAHVDMMPLTSIEQSHLTDGELIEAAVVEAHKIGAIGSDGGWDTEEDFRADLRIGDWTER